MRDLSMPVKPMFLYYAFTHYHFKQSEESNLRKGYTNEKN